MTQSDLQLFQNVKTAHTEVSVVGEDDLDKSWGEREPEVFDGRVQAGRLGQ